MQDWSVSIAYALDILQYCTKPWYEGIMTSNCLTLLALQWNRNVVYWCPWWRHQMETFSALLAICAGNSPVTVDSPHKGQWRGVSMFVLIWAWINGWVNNGEAGDLRCHHAHYDVTLMHWLHWKLSLTAISLKWHFCNSVCEGKAPVDSPNKGPVM